MKLINVTHSPLTSISDLVYFFAKKMAQNVRFYYLYRDSGNYKKFGFKDFSNPFSLNLVEIEQKIRSNLISTEFFYPEKVGIQKFKFHRYCDDFSWYEFEKIELVESRKPKKSLDDFFKILKVNRIQL